jgi:sugar/nucleoside kinase (ribokinase family)
MSRLGAPRILVVGELNVDVIAAGVQRIPRMGTEVIAKDCQLTLGSASAIFAVGIARLGSRVTFVSQVGTDNFGDFCLSALKREGISITHVLSKKTEKTGVTISLSGARDRALITYPGAIASFTGAEFDKSLMRRHQHLHMTSYYLQQGLQPAFADIFKQAKARGLTTSFDPNSDPTASWSKDITKVLRNTDVLFVNQREASELTGFKSTGDAMKALGQLVPCAVIKLGRKGAVAIQNNNVVKHSGFRVDALDTTGAGDSFDAGFISTYLRGGSMQDCLKHGNACGALSTLQAGGTAGQPTRRHLEEFLQKKSSHGGPIHKSLI